MDLKILLIILLTFKSIKSYDNLHYKITRGVRVVDETMFRYLGVVLDAGTPVAGGALINDKYVISLASATLRKSNLSVCLDLKELKRPLRNGIEVIDIIIHPKFRRYTYHNEFDIALLKMKFPARVKPICILEEEDNLENKFATIAGFGEQKYSLRGVEHPIGFVIMRNRLYQAGVKIQTTDWCKKNRFVGKFDPENYVCSISTRAACHGDAGFPVVYETEQSTLTMIAMITERVSCGRKGVADVYIKMAPLANWIDTNTADAIKCVP